MRIRPIVLPVEKEKEKERKDTMVKNFGGCLGLLWTVSVVEGLNGVQGLLDIINLLCKH